MGVALPKRAQPGKKVMAALSGAPWNLGVLLVFLVAGLLIISAAIDGENEGFLSDEWQKEMERCSILFLC
jgi:hypothetical protein